MKHYYPTLYWKNHMFVFNAFTFISGIAMYTFLCQKCMRHISMSVQAKQLRYNGTWVKIPNEDYHWASLNSFQYYFMKKCTVSNREYHLQSLLK